MVQSAECAASYLDWFCSLTSKNSARFSVTVVAAHPDDEIIGAGVQLTKLARPAVLFLTDGSPRNMHDARFAGCGSAAEYAKKRWCEALVALSMCGIRQDRVLSLGVPDQEAAHNMAFLSREVALLLDLLASDIVVTHPYEGGHPDHDATAFCVQAASSLLERAGRRPPAALLEFTSYHAASIGIETGRFLPNGGAVKTIKLSLQEQDLKREMFARYATQRQVLAQFPLSTESFRLAPAYDFTKPPDAPVYYERFDWGIRPSDWPGLVSEATRQLNLG